MHCEIITQALKKKMKTSIQAKAMITSIEKIQMS